MTTRRAYVEDINQLAPLFDAYRIFYKQDRDIKGAKAFLMSRFSLKDFVIFVATNDQEIVGFTQLYPTYSSVKMQRAYILNDLYVSKTQRKKGIGEALLNTAKQFCETEQLRGLTLETDLDNPAQHLYERLGWKKDTDVLHYTWELNSPH
jgi:ribosomal protein S18 acetylase RimI-like enzyme